MAKTSIHIEKVKGTSEEHNKREKELDYVRKGLTPLNESFVLCSVPECLEEIKQRYQKTTGQKMQAKASPVREGVIVIQENTTMNQLKLYAEKCKKRFGIQAIQIHIHRDEGHEKEGEWKKNLHAHIVFDWTASNGKTIKLSKQDISEMQTILADCLKMERGVSSDVRHLNAIQFKVKEEEKRLEQAEAIISRCNIELIEITDKTRELKQELPQLRNEFNSLTEQIEFKKAEFEKQNAILKRYDELKPLLDNWEKNIFGNVKLEPLIANYDKLREEYIAAVKKLEGELNKAQSTANGNRFLYEREQASKEKLNADLETASKVQRNQVAMLSQLKEKVESTLDKINKFHESKGIDWRYYFGDDGNLKAVTPEQFKQTTQREERSQNRGNSNQLKM